mgnify:CR=1 FL=1
MYRTFPVVGSRVAIWAVAQLHLLFAAFVLAVPIFAFIVEAIGYKTGDLRYDRLAHEFTKLLSVSFSLTATFGAFLTFMLIALYPKFTELPDERVLPDVPPVRPALLRRSLLPLHLLLRLGKFHPLVHLGLGLGLNLVGTAIMLIANAWLTFMMSPRGVLGHGGGALRLGRDLQLHVDADQRPSSHRERRVRRIGRRRLRGRQVPAGDTDEDRAHYDWMGYIGNFVAISAFLPLPFAGYWLAKEIYAYSQTLGLTMMGGAFSWLFIIQAVLIGNLFLAANYYLWLGMGRVEGVQPLQKFIKYLLFAITLCFMVWATPRSIIATVSELRAMGGSAHPILGYLGVMSAKNTAVNILILTTFMSFLLYRRTGKIATVSWAKDGPCGAAHDLRRRRVHRHLPRRLRVHFVEATVRIRLLGAAGQLGAVRDGVDHRHRRVPVPRREQDRRGALGQDSSDLPVRADLHRGHFHVAHGAHGLRALRPPPALARLRRHAGPLR